MSANVISLLKFNGNIPLKQNQEAKNNNKTKVNKENSSEFVAYPKAYYLNQISFGARKATTANEIIERIGEDNFPNPEIVEILRGIGNSTDFSLYDIHLNYYKDLLDCSTLDEAKEKYPEFKDVIDAKDVDYSHLHSNNIMRMISDGRVSGADLDNLSLVLLKNHYGLLQGINRKESYFDLSNTPVKKILEALNIKIHTMKYINNATSSNPDVREKQSKSLSAHLATPEVREQRREAMKTRWANDDGTMRAYSQINVKRMQTPEAKAKRKATCDTDEYRQQLSSRMQKRWQEDEEFKRIQKEKAWIDSEYIERQRQTSLESWARADEARHEISRQNVKKAHAPEAIAKMKATKNTDEFKEKLSATMTEFFENNPIYAEAQKLAWQRHPEIAETMAEIATHYPALGVIIHKKENGLALTDKEDKIHKTYYKECSAAMPD